MLFKKGDWLFSMTSDRFEKIKTLDFSIEDNVIINSKYAAWLDTLKTEIVSLRALSGYIPRRVFTINNQMTKTQKFCFKILKRRF